MSYFADIVFPNPIRQAFTYALPAGLANKAVPGIRVWVPLKNHFAFGMIVAVHQNVPDFEVKPVERILDDEVIFSENLLKLSHWMHRFYFCGWGEVIQAALPAGLNFEHKRIVKANPGKKPKTDAKELELWEHVMSPEEITEKNFLKQWKGQAYKKAYKALLKNGALSIWEEPVKKTTPKKCWPGNGQMKMHRSGQPTFSTSSKALLQNGSRHWIPCWG